MKMQIPVIRDHMTPAPITVEVDQTLEAAQKLMSGRDCRHLPVMENGKLVGVLSDRDIGLSLALRKKDAHELLVRNVFVPFPYSVDINEPLHKVLRDMVTLHIGSALVLEGGKLTGIFTTMDACSSFSDFLAEACGTED